MLPYISLSDKPWPLMPSSWFACSDARIKEVSCGFALFDMMLLFNRYLCHVGLEVEDSLADPSPGLRHPARS